MGLQFAIDLVDGELESAFEGVEGQAHVTGQRGFDRLADVVVDFGVIGLGIDETKPGFVHFLLTHLVGFTSFLRFKARLSGGDREDQARLSCNGSSHL